MSLELDRAALDRALDQLEGMSDRADRLRPFLLEVADDMRALNRDRMTTRRGWAPLSPAYAARKTRERPGRPPGVYTGTLLASLTRRGAPFHAEKITGDSVEVTTRAPHAHLFDAGRGGQPARDLVVRRALNSRADAWRAELLRYLTTGEARL